MNIISIVANDDHCGIVDENGQIRLLTKGIDGEIFKDLLEMENKSAILNKKMHGIEKKKDILYKKNIVPFMLSVIFLLLLFVPSLFEISFDLLSNIALIGSFVSSMAVCISNTLEYVKHDKEYSKLVKQKRKLDRKIRKMIDKYLIVERILFSRDETVKGNESEESTVNECASYLYRILESNIGKIDTFHYEYYNNPYLSSDKIKLLLPINKDEMEKTCQIAKEVGNSQDIFSIRSFEYSQLDYLDDGQQRQLKKTYRL